jgi:hypothetical protein
LPSRRFRGDESFHVAWRDPGERGVAKERG